VTIVGELLLLCALYLVHFLISFSNVLIPASVICMLALFLGLLLLERVIGTRRVSTLLKYLTMGTGFSLTWISLFFTPAFVLLPLAESVSIAEAFKIGAVFIFGWVITMALIVWLVWGLQFIMGPKKKGYDRENSENNDVEGNDENTGSTVELLPRNTRRSNDLSGLEVPEPVAEINRPNNPGVSVSFTEEEELHASQHPIIHQQPNEEMILAHREKRIAAFVSINIDFIIYWIMFVVGLGVYFGTGYNMPVQLAIVTLSFKYALLVPQKYKVYLHPILVCAGISILTIYILALIYGESLSASLHRFKTGRNYLTLFDSGQRGVLPGAGDVISTLLDTSIVVLAFPMYNYRSDLKKNFIFLMIPSVFAALASFFVYPPLCYAIGISNTRSIAFIARSVTLALAIPIVSALKGAETLVAVVGILSGIIGVLLGSFVLGKKFLRVREDDYVARGVTLGINSSAVASAHLLTSDPRAGALSSLSFFIFGTILIVLAAITPLANLVRSWVDLGPL
jgi:putative effector of murein hydrolase/putative effector of murein hydrolase LrgA (UPF0299 family)